MQTDVLTEASVLKMSNDCKCYSKTIFFSIQIWFYVQHLSGSV